VLLARCFENEIHAKLLFVKMSYQSQDMKIKSINYASDQFQAKLRVTFNFMGRAR
jgi:hypothetical protein